MTQQGDIRLFQTDDGGEISVTGGVVDMDGGLETAVYLSLFGGNEDDGGREATPAGWWANLSEVDPAKKYRSETQYLLQAIPATSGNLRRIEEAVKSDLAWLISEGAASAVSVSVSVEGLNLVRVAVNIEADSGEFNFVFAENWKAVV